MYGRAAGAGLVQATWTTARAPARGCRGSSGGSVISRHSGLVTEQLPGRGSRRRRGQRGRVVEPAPRHPPGDGQQWRQRRGCNRGPAPTGTQARWVLPCGGVVWSKGIMFLTGRGGGGESTLHGATLKYCVAYHHEQQNIQFDLLCGPIEGPAPPPCSPGDFVGTACILTNTKSTSLHC